MVFYLCSFTIKTPLLTYNRFQIQALDFRSQNVITVATQAVQVLIQVVYIWSSFFQLTVELRDLSQAEKTITVVTS